MRLIDADALPVQEFWVSESIYGTIGRYMVVHKAALDAAPTIEAEPVRHGRWIQRRNGKYHCTNCGREERFIYQKDYCPRCGAKMDLRTPTEVQLDEADSVMMGDADNG